MRSVRLPLLLVLLSSAGCGQSDRPPVEPPAPVPPESAVAMTPSADPDTNDTLVFALSCDQGACSFECALDDAAFSACAPETSLVGLAAGPHTFAVRATSAEGLVESTPETITFNLAFAWREVAGGVEVMCGIAGDGGLHCWGTRQYGQLGDGLDDGLVVPQPTRVGDANDWSELVAGTHTFCARRRDGRYCWGANWDGQLLDPGLDDEVLAPTRIAALSYAQLALGENHACGIDAMGALYCWGAGNRGQLGDGLSTSSATPVRVGTDTWAAVSAGDDFTCGIHTTGALYCWGQNGDGQAGQAGGSNVTTPAQVGLAEDWSSVSTASAHACGLRAGDALYCWGNNDAGQLGDGSQDPTDSPVQVAGAWRAVQTAWEHTCAADTAGQVSCWGENRQAQLGNTTQLVERVSSPTAISYTGRVLGLAGRGALSCALGERDVLCWGDQRGADGALGRGLPAYQYAAAPTDSGYRQVATSSTGGCGIRASGRLECWGIGPHVGQTTPVAFVPVGVTEDTDWSDLTVRSDGDARSGHACGVRAGRLFCWGQGSDGQLGDGSATYQARPVEVTQLAGPWARVSTGAYSTCATTTAGGLYCWGGGTTSGGVFQPTPNRGQNGDGTTLQRDTPVQVTSPAATGWLSVAVYNQRATALRDDGTLWAWGGNSASDAQTTPAQLGTARDWVSAAGTHTGSCAINTGGELHCTTYQGTPGWPRPLARVGVDSDHGVVVPRGSRVCSLSDAGALRCFYETSTWVDDAQFLAEYTFAGAWRFMSLHAGNGVMCGLRANGARECAGVRFLGSFGDDFDERLPTPVRAP